jgi:hypothetical protein
VSAHFSDVPVGLGEMLKFLSATYWLRHRSRTEPELCVRWIEIRWWIWPVCTVADWHSCVMMLMLSSITGSGLAQAPVAERPVALPPNRTGGSCYDHLPTCHATLEFD